MRLRPYQISARNSAFTEWENGFRSTLIVMPTASGKTILFSSIIEKIQPKRTMVLAHRQELIFQARDKIEKVTGLKADIEMGEYKSSRDGNLFHPSAQVIVSTIQTHSSGGDGGGRMTKFDPSDFGLLIVDESHHSTSKSYKKVIDYYLQNPELKVLGVTATPDRADEEALGQIFETVAFNYEILDAIKDGWIVPVEQQMVHVDSINFSEVRTTAGDLNGADLAAVMESEKNLHGVASSTISIIGNKRGIGFASSVNHARILSDIFNRHKLGMAAWVCGKTETNERKKIISDFAAGRIQWLWNCGVFTEGFDDSGVEIIAMARPTKSRSLYAQMAGRAFRPHESIAHKLNELPNAAIRRSLISRSIKPSALIIDFVGNSGKHKLMTTADILGGNYSDEAIQSALEIAKKSGNRMRMDKSIEEEEKRIEEKKKREIEAAARKAKLVASSTYKTQSVDPFDIFDIKPSKPRGWDEGKVASEGMKKVLRKMGLNPDDFNYAQSRQLVSEQINRWNKNLCSIKQAQLLKKFGYSADLTFQDAKKTIDAIAANGWRKPQGEIIPKIKLPTRKVASDYDYANDDVPF